MSIESFFTVLAHRNTVTAAPVVNELIAAPDINYESCINIGLAVSKKYYKWIKYGDVRNKKRLMVCLYCEGKSNNGYSIITYKPLVRRELDKHEASSTHIIQEASFVSKGTVLKELLHAELTREVHR